MTLFQAFGCHFWFRLTRAPMGCSQTLSGDRGGGGARFGPLAICQTPGPIVDPKTVFDRSGNEVLEYVAKFYLNHTDDVTVRVKREIFYCHCRLRRAKRPYHIEIKSMERHGTYLGYF